jgi:transposase
MSTPKVRPKTLTFGVFFMVKYDEGFKQQVVDAYLAGEGGYSYIAKKFGVRSKTNVRKWVSAFKQLGKDGLLRKKLKTTYPVQFKLDVLNYKLKTGESFESVALEFGIHEPPLIVNWMNSWQKEGVEGLSKIRGHPLMSNKPKKKESERKLTKEQQLEKEIELLRAENAYLKKLRASGINIPSRLLKQNRE